MNTPLRHWRFLLACLSRKDEDTFGEPAAITCPECKERILSAAVTIAQTAQKKHIEQMQNKKVEVRA